MPENLLHYQAEQEPVRGENGRFVKGHSGNPAGRPAGRRNNATLISEAMFDAEAATLTRTAIDLALDGNASALRLCLQRLLAPRRERPVGFAMPPIENAGDIVRAMAAVTAAVADGTLSPSDAYALSQTVNTFLRAIDARCRGPAAAARGGRCGGAMKSASLTWKNACRPTRRGRRAAAAGGCGCW